MSKEKNFEASLEELEKIVEELEKGSLPLEDALKAFEQGIKLARRCSTLLDEAEKRVKILTGEGEQGFLSEDENLSG